MYHIVTQRVGKIKGGRTVKVTIPFCIASCSEELSNSFTVVVVVAAAAADDDTDVSSEFAKLICRFLINVEWSRSHADRLTKLEGLLLFHYI